MTKYSVACYRSVAVIIIFAASWIFTAPSNCNAQGRKLAKEINDLKMQMAGKLVYEQYDEALKLLEDKRRELENDPKLTEQDIDGAISFLVFRLPDLYAAANDFPNAIRAQKEHLERSSKSFGSDHPLLEVIKSQIDELEIAAKLDDDERKQVAAAIGKFRKAEVLMGISGIRQASEAIKEPVVTLPKHLGQLSEYALTARRLELEIAIRANESVTERALALSKDFGKKYGANSLRTIFVDQTLAQQYQRDREYAKAEKLLTRVRDYFHEMIDDGGIENYIRVQLDIANVLARQNKIRESIQIRNEVGMILNDENDQHFEARFENELSIASRLLEFRDFELAQQSIDRTFEYSRRSIERFGDTSKNRIYTAQSYLIQARSEGLQGHFETAEETILRAVESVSIDDFKSRGERYWGSAMYASLAHAQLHQKKLKESEASIKMALKLITWSSSDARLARRNCYRHLGNLQMGMENYDEAEKSLKNAIPRNKRQLSSQDSYSYNLLGLAYKAQKKHDLAQDAFESSMDLLFKQANDLFLFLDDHSAAQIVDGWHDVVMNYLNNEHARPKADWSRSFVYVANFKGLVTRYMANRNELAANLIQKNDRVKKEEFDRAKARISSIVLNSLLTEQDIGNATTASKLALEFAALTSDTTDDLFQVKQITKAEILERLPADTAIVEFVKFHNRKGANKYLAYVVTRDAELKTALVDLGTVTEITSWIERYQKQLTLGNRGLKPGLKPTRLPKSNLARPVHQIGQEIFKRYFAKIEKQLNGKKKILFSTDHDLSFLPWHALVNPETQTAIGDHYSISYAESSGIWLKSHAPGNKATAKPAPDKTPKGSLLLVGGIDYANRTLPGSDNQPMAPLPGARAEVESLNKSLGQNIPTVVLQESKATEQAVLDALPKARYAHFATHGFVISNPQSNIYYPQSSSGLVVSKPNSNEDDSYDGFITGEEIGALNLHNCELVVLTACDSSGGTTFEMEGTFGIRKAFEVAGAKTTITSLWPVDDEQTRHFAELFYKAFTQEKKTALEALRWTQAELRKQGKPVEVWGAWVLHGKRDLKFKP